MDKRFAGKLIRALGRMDRTLAKSREVRFSECGPVEPDSAISHIPRRPFYKSVSRDLGDALWDLLWWHTWLKVPVPAYRILKLVGPRWHFER